ncbi:hypothetical protein PQX77_021383 [Marasmius sp. AFHP31]|nr:hypothetical protein PQX77_021383 [Marasmius sp. AFHP31]
MYDRTKYDFSPLLDEVFGHDLGLNPAPSQRPSAPSHRPPRTKPGAVPTCAPSQPPHPPGTISHGLSGFGRRNSFLLVYVAAFVLANQVALREQGLRLHFTIFEKQSESEAGSGYSCQTKSDGALNTGLPGQVNIPTVNMDRITGSTNLTDLTNLAQCIGGDLQSDVEKHQKALREANLAALAMFADATTPAGMVDTDHAFTTRGAVGTIQQPKILNALKFIEEEMSDLITIVKMFRHEVVDVDVTNPQKPKLKVQSLGPEDPMSPLSTVMGSNFDFPSDPPMSTPKELVFDFIHLSNGTPWRSPVPQLKSSDLPIFSRIPNLQSVGAFLEHCTLLENRVLKGGSRIGIAGFSLSAYDFVPLILQHTSILQPTPKGYEIIEQEAEKYQGLLTFFSNMGVPTPPRHLIPNPTEMTPTILTIRPILTTTEVHTLLLQRNFQWLQFWKVFLDANVARHLRKLPEALQYKQLMSAEARMKDYAKQTEAYYANRLTEVGLLREGYWSVYGGQGFEVGQDLEMAEQNLIATAPLTRSERAGFPLRRAQLSDITSREHVMAGNPNTDFFHEYGIMQHTIAASPSKIHYLIARLFELGVAKHVRKNFDTVTDPNLASPDGAESATIQALFAPLLLDRGMDRAYQSLLGRVAEVVPGQPEYAKGRFLKSHDGKLVHAMDMGMGGSGGPIKSGNHISKVGMRWPDTSALNAAVDGAPIAAVMTVLLSSYAQQESIKKPVEHLLEEYKRGLPTEEDYEKEVDSFKPVWEEMNKKHAFLELCEKVAQDGSQYVTYTDSVFEEPKRREVLKQVEEREGNTDDHRRALDDYRNAVANIPPFAPPTVHDYFERFIDFSPSELTRCWTEHRKWVEGRKSS